MSRLAKIAFGALMIAWTSPSFATLPPVPVEMTCPYDGTKFTFQSQVSSITMDQTLDWKPVGMGVLPWPLPVCPTNGFVFYKLQFSQDEFERLRPYVLSSNYKALAEDSIYYRAARLMELAGGSHDDVTWALVEATWQVNSQRQKYVNYANEVLARLPTDIAVASGDKKRGLVLLRGELLRRLARFDEAREYFVHLNGAVDPKDALYVAFELKLIDEKDTSAYLKSEIPTAEESDSAVWLANRAPILPPDSKLARTHAFRSNGMNVHWQPDGTMLSVSTRANLVEFDLRSKARNERVPPATFGNVAFSKDGKTLVGSNPDASVTPHLYEFDAATYQISHSAPAPSWVLGILMSYDGRSALVQVKQGLIAYDLGRAIVRELSSPQYGDTEYWTLGAVDPSGPRVAIVHDQGLDIWDYEKGVFAQHLNPTVLTRSFGDSGVVYSREGTKLVIVKGDIDARRCGISILDIRTGKQEAETWVAGDGGVAQLQISPDEKHMAVLCGQSLYVGPAGFGGSSTQVIEARKGNTIYETAFSPDSRNLAIRTQQVLLVYAVTP